MLNTRLRRCAFMPSGTGYGLVPLYRGLVFIFMMPGTFASFGRRHIDTVFAVGTVRRSGKYTVESC